MQVMRISLFRLDDTLISVISVAIAGRIAHASTVYNLQLSEIPRIPDINYKDLIKIISAQAYIRNYI